MSRLPDDSLVGLLERQMAGHAARLATGGKSQRWNYEQLERVSRCCAAGIQDRCPGAAAPIAVVMEHDAPLLAALTGVVRSGAFYAVLNPSLPPAQLRQQLASIRPKATLTDARHAGLVSELGSCTGSPLAYEQLIQCDKPVTTPEWDRDSLLGIFYTSGSSGAPEPMVYSHEATLHNVSNHIRSLGITPEDRLSLLSPCSTAASVSALFGALLSGASVMPFDAAREGLHKVIEWIQRERITVYHSVPSLFRRLLQLLPAGQMLDSVRLVKLSGEPVFTSDLELFGRHFREDCVLMNGLGMTQANGNVCHHRLTKRSLPHAGTIPVGRPLEGVELRVINDAGDEMPAGEIGELALRGQFLSPGKWDGNKVEPRAPETGGWYRTGDLGRYDAEGILEHAGRRDGQYKVRGTWVCPAWIEAALMSKAPVRQAVTVAVPRDAAASEEQALVAFVACDGDTEAGATEKELLEQLREQLPPQMVPRRLIARQQLPVLPGGKIDRAELARQAAASVACEQEPAVDITDPLLLQMASIWRKVLKVKRVGPTDNFFELGGDSLAAVALFAGIAKYMGSDEPVATLLRAPTLQHLTRAVRRGTGSESDLRLVALQLGEDRPALYCVPGAGADASSLRHLARRLGEQQPFFAFQPLGLDGRTPHLRSVEAMGDHYLRTLREHQPRGPYHLCGSSFGGVVAFEMAQRLVADGEEVAFLGLFDSYGGDYPRPRRDLSLIGRARLFARRLLPLGRRDEFSWPNLKRGLHEAWRRQRVNLDLKFHFRKPPRPHHLRMVYLEQAGSAARRRYCFRVFPGKIHLFRVEHQPSPELFEADPFLGWRGMALKGIEIHELPGGHGRHIAEPNVTILAQKILECLPS